MEAHFHNDTWIKRKNPPKDWSKPLPDYIAKKTQNSYLEIKNKELRGEVTPDSNMDLKEPTYCTLM